MTGSVDGCSILPENHLVGTILHMDITLVLSVDGSLTPWGAARERSRFNVKPPFEVPLLIFPRGYLVKSFPEGMLPQDSGGLKSKFSLS